MLRHAKGLVSCLLPIVPIVFLHGCGGGGAGESSAQAQAPAAQAPAAPAGNHAPSITGSARDVARVGEAYEFQPIAVDVDGDTLQFSATNLPPWASLDPVSGRLSGTPGDGDVGIHESISIVVADSSGRTETPPFSITVVPDAAAGVASLRWETPPSKVDGSPLDDLAGYRILYGRDGADLDRSVLVNDPAATTYQFTTLPTGVWYFAVVAVNAGGLEGPPTVTTMKSI